eukprot:3981450-Alexandrium_andersonii.AAC.1
MPAKMPEYSCFAARSSSKFFQASRARVGGREAHAKQGRRHHVETGCGPRRRRRICRIAA